MSLLPRDALGADTETFLIDNRALQAPPIVCLQVGDTTGNHEVLITRRVRDGLYHLFDRQRSQIWFHNGPFDVACILEWYPEPELVALVWDAMQRGALLDTMYLARLSQIARGALGPLGLDVVAQQYGVKPPTKAIAAELDGVTYDVRTSFGLWYQAEHIPDPWHSYADYDGEVMLPLASRMVERHCTPKKGERSAEVRLEDLGQVVRNYVGHHLWRTYGLRVDPKTVVDLAGAARSTMLRLQGVAQHNGFLRPRKADRKKGETPHPAVKFCDKQRSKSERTRAKHAECRGCVAQGVDANGDLTWGKDMAAIKRAVSEAYGGNPPRTEKKKCRKTGRTRGGGAIATSRHVLQDSHNEELQRWSEYNEWLALVAKDLKIFARGVVHTRIGIANTLRITSAGPNVLNFRRNSFYVGTCDACGFETSVEASDVKNPPACPRFSG